MSATRDCLPRHCGCGAILGKIAKSTQLPLKDVKRVVSALQTIAMVEVERKREFVISKHTTLKVKRKPEPAADRFAFRIYPLCRGNTLLESPLTEGNTPPESPLTESMSLGPAAARFAFNLGQGSTLTESVLMD